MTFKSNFHNNSNMNFIFESVCKQQISSNYFHFILTRGYFSTILRHLNGTLQSFHVHFNGISMTRIFYTSRLMNIHTWSEYFYWGITYVWKKYTEIRIFTKTSSYIQYDRYSGFGKFMLPSEVVILLTTKSKRWVPEFTETIVSIYFIETKKWK